MNKIFNHSAFTECYFLQLIHQVRLIEPTSSQTELYLFLFRVSEKENYNQEIATQLYVVLLETKR